MFLLQEEAPDVSRLESPDPDADDPLYFETQHMCPCCQEYLVYTDEVYLVEVTEAAQDGGRIATQPMISDEGDYLYEPYIMHFQCWEEVLEQIREATQDQPPVECVDGILFCKCCGSTIGNFEPYVAAYIGEIRVSQRSPNLTKNDKIERYPDADPICLACIVHVFEEHFEDWEDLFAEFNIGTEDDDDES